MLAKIKENWVRAAFWEWNSEDHFKNSANKQKSPEDCDIFEASLYLVPRKGVL